MPLVLGTPHSAATVRDPPEFENSCVLALPSIPEVKDSLDLRLNEPLWFL